MTVGLEFGIDQAVVHTDLELASVRGDQGQALEVVLEFLEQVVCQAHGPVGVMSYSAVDDFDVYHWVVLSKASSLSGGSNDSETRSRSAILKRPSTALPTVAPLRDGNSGLLENYNMCTVETCHM